MECTKCKTELKEDSGFCPKCGQKIEEEKSLGDSYKQASGCWFLLGRLYGTLKAKKDEEGLKEIEGYLKKCNLYDEYLEALNFAEKHVFKYKLNKKGSQHP